MEDDGEVLEQRIGISSAAVQGLLPPLSPVPPYFFGELLPGAVGVAHVKLAALIRLQLAVIEELIGHLEDGLVGPGGGKTVQCRRDLMLSSGTRHPGLQVSPIPRAMAPMRSGTAPRALH